MKVRSEDIHNNTINMSLLDYFNITIILNIKLPDEFKDHIDTLTLLQELSHNYIINPNLFNESLNNLVSIFSSLKLIFVDENKGYYILDDISKIRFQRITRGSPRFIFSS